MRDQEGAWIWDLGRPLFSVLVLGFGFTFGGFGCVPFSSQIGIQGLRVQNCQVQLEIHTEKVEGGCLSYRVLGLLSF